jgi:RimJ/RimL family protein N-acetyltransferase
VDTPPILRDFPSRFESGRLVIRRPEPGDGAELNAAVRESWDDLHEWMPWAVRRPTVEESEEVVRRWHAKFVEREDLLFLFFLKDEPTLVGAGGLHRIDWRVPSFDVGYWRRAGFERRGYVTEAVVGLVDFAVRHFGARRIVVTCDAENVRSAAVARRAGFALESTRRNDRRHHHSGELRDTLVFARTEGDPPARRR